jgi:predicted transcriptional regulator
VQTEIISAVWRKGEASVSDVLEALPKTRRVARTTVQTLLARLEAKGWLTHREEGNAFIYRATASPRQSQRGILARLLDTVFNGSVEGLIMALLDQHGVTEEEANRIKAMITEKAVRGPNKKPKP